MAKELKDLTKSDENYSQWYNDLVVKAGWPRIRPYAVVWSSNPMAMPSGEKMHDALDKMFKDTGHQNAYFPLFIPNRSSRKRPTMSRALPRRCAVVTHYRLKNDPEGKGVVVDPDAKARRGADRASDLGDHYLEYL